MLRRTIALTMSTLFLCSACATIVSKSEYPVTMKSEPAGATVRILNEKGEVVHQGSTPFLLSLKAGDAYFSKAHYTLEYTMAGYQPQKVELTPTLNGWYWGNLLIGGVIGMVIVDPLTGAMYKLPDTHKETLKALPAVASTPAQNLQVQNYQQLDLQQQKALVRIK